MAEAQSSFDNSTKHASNNFVCLSLNQGPFHLTQLIRSFKNKIIIFQYNSNLLSSELSQFLSIESKTSNMILQ